MVEKHLEDDFNSWVRREGCGARYLKAQHATDEECWVAVIEHKNPEILCEDALLILAFLEEGKQEGYISRYWYEDIRDEHLFKIGRKIAFCYNG